MEEPNNPLLTSGTEGISRSELPHASEELSKATEEEGHAYHDVGDSDVACVDIVEGEN
jgi:hypothetical protein